MLFLQNNWDDFLDAHGDPLLKLPSRAFHDWGI
jgi:hypothetical protein